MLKIRLWVKKMAEYLTGGLRTAVVSVDHGGTMMDKDSGDRMENEAGMRQWERERGPENEM